MQNDQKKNMNQKFDFLICKVTDPFQVDCCAQVITG